MCQSLDSKHPLFVMMDANAKSGPLHEPFVKDSDSCSANTPFLLEFLQTLQLHLPCTSAVHSGDKTTWTSPDGTTTHRIDFIALPVSFESCCSHSQVLDSFDVGNLHADHSAIAVQLEWPTASSSGSRRTSYPGHARDHIALQHHKFDFSVLPAQSWHGDIETQVRSLNSSIHDILTNCCPGPRQQPKKPFVQDHAWLVRSRKLS